ncbi:MAG: hypothetical protein K0S32_168 [Bacteroidetes bacterium]|jgi:hypothetical protein|nr:hypothetical protein [Bacteroidota bacterium]
MTVFLTAFTIGIKLEGQKTVIKRLCLNLKIKVMKTKNLLILASSLFIMSACEGQNTKRSLSEKPESKSIPLTDSIKKEPDVRVKVNKKYDDKGNIIRYDSTYSYVYSSPGGTLHMSNDSIFNHFRSYFHKNHSAFMNPETDNIFFNDSLFKYDFFNEDYFFKRFQLNKGAFEDMFKQMDSLKNNYLEKNYPKGQNKPKTI